MKSFCLLLACLLCCYMGIQAQTFPSNNFTLTTVSDGWVQALGATFSKDGQQLFVWEKSGRVILCKKNGNIYERQTTPVINIPDEVLNWADNGLMGFALDPNFLSNGYIYLLYAVDRRFLMNDNGIVADEGHNATIGRLTRYTTITSGGNLVADLSTRTILIGETKTTGIPLIGETHGLGSLVFAEDGSLLVSAGDAAHFEDEDNGNEPATFYAQALIDGIIRPEENVGTFRAQMLNSHNGKLLRIDPATGNGIPSNPFYDAGSPRSPKSRVWALGLRNPFRITIKPGSGSTDPMVGDIGEVYIGDVGYEAWEDFNIVTAPGQNFGWPLYEGLEVCTRFSAKAASTQNLDEPNPLAGAGCARPFFTFRELIKDPTPDGNSTIYNPCDPSEVIGSGHRFVHRRPALDFRHNQELARVGIFSGDEPAVAVIGTPESGVNGSPFGGYCAVAGMWYNGDNFPAEYKDKFFLADWASGWIRDVSIDYTDVVTQVGTFATGFEEILCLAQNPVDGKVVIVCGWPHVMIMEYGGNQLPVAKPVADVIYGSSPLTVNFTGDASFDLSPGGSIVDYEWDFDGGVPGTSTLQNPGEVVFTESSGNPKKFVVTLTVTDNEGGTHTGSVIISVNNTPPVVNITSPVRNSTYEPLGTDVTYNCVATVIDGEHEPAELKYEWQTFLRHNMHEHAGVIDNNVNTTTRIARVGCSGSDTYYWFLKLTVTDAAGLSTVDSLKLFPDCGTAIDNTPPVVNVVVPSDGADEVSTETTITVIFDEPIDPASVSDETFVFVDGIGTEIPASIAVNSNEITLTPTEQLEPAAVYTATLKSGSPAVMDLAGNELAVDYTWSFTTEASTLPVLLHQFSVTQNGSVNLVKWTTDMESLMEYFELEHSTNGINFSPINRQAALNTGGKTEYSYADNRFTPGRNYYRLKMVEQGNIVSYSVIIKTVTEKDYHELQVMPNPVTGSFYISYYSLSEEDVSFEIKDLAGRVLQVRKERVSRGHNMIRVENLPNWAPGVYFLEVQDKNEKQRLKFLKSR